MTHEKRYETVCRMLKTFDNMTGNNGAAKVIAHPDKWEKSTHFPFYADCASLIIEAKTAMDAKKTSKSSLSAMKRIVRNSRSGLDGMFQAEGNDGRTRYVLCDGYRLVRLFNDYPSIPHIEKAALSAKGIEDILRGATRACTGRLLELPTEADLKAYIASYKAEHGKTRVIPYQLGKCYVNAEYLLDFLQVLPGCDAAEPDHPVAPIYLTSDVGDGVLLPIHPGSLPH